MKDIKAVYDSTATVGELTSRSEMQTTSPPATCSSLYVVAGCETQGGQLSEGHPRRALILNCYHRGNVTLTSQVALGSQIRSSKAVGVDTSYWFASHSVHVLHTRSWKGLGKGGEGRLCDVRLTYGPPPPILTPTFG